jgi:hypothetical protein
MTELTQTIEDAINSHQEALTYLNNTEENKFTKILPQKTKNAYNLIAEYCIKEYNEKYGEMPEEEYMRFLVGDYCGTGNGRTICILCSQCMPYESDYNKTAPYPRNHEPVNSKEYRAVREFHQEFGSWMLYGITFVSREDFFEKYGHFLPSSLIELKDKSCYLNYHSKLHFNFS